MELNSRSITFISLLGALGNILFIVSNYAGQIVPGVSIDLSHIPTFIASIYGGPLIGFLTGFLVGVLPGIYYGPLSPHGSIITLILLPLGKSLTGLTTGVLFKVFNANQRKHKSLIVVPLVLLSYVPECLYTVLYFMVLLPLLAGIGAAGILIYVLPKAWAEIIFMSILMAALRGNDGFNSTILSLIGIKEN